MYLFIFFVRVLSIWFFKLFILSKLYWAHPVASIALSRYHVYFCLFIKRAKKLNNSVDSLPLDLFLPNIFSVYPLVIYTFRGRDTPLKKYVSHVGLWVLFVTYEMSAINILCLLTFLLHVKLVIYYSVKMYLYSKVICHHLRYFFIC